MMSFPKFRCLCVLLCALAGLVCGLPGWAEDGPRISRLTDLVEWVIDIPLTEAQRASLGSLLTSLPEARLQEAATDADRLEKLSSEQRSSLRPQLRSRLLSAGSPLASWAQQTETSAAQVIVAGPPPLTQQVVSSLTEWLLFAVDPSTPPEAYPQLRVSLGTGLIQIYPRLQAPQRAHLLTLPQQWANLRKKWPSLSSSEREQLRAQWKTVLGHIVRREDKMRLAKAVIDNLKQALDQHVDITPKLAKLSTLCASLRKENDPECTALADQLDIAILNFQQGQQQAEAIQKINELSSQLARRSKLPGTDPASLKPVFMRQGGIFVGGDGRLPYRF